MSRGMTLIELLVVTGVIAMLAGLIAVAALRARENARRLEAQSTIEAMGAALLKLKHDYAIEGVLGKTEAGVRDLALFDNGEVLKELSPRLPEFDGFSPRFNPARNVYMDFKQHQLRGGAVVDPWGSPYRYLVYVVETNRWPYEVEALYSAGLDGIPKNRDDVVRAISRTPVPASRENPAAPVLDRAMIEEKIGWIDKPGEWP